MKQFYLELNPLIVAGKKLKVCDFSTAYVYTSYWSIMEQITSISENNYRIVRSPLCLIRELGIQVDWESTISKLYSAFGLVSPFRKTDVLVKSIFEEILKVQEYCDLSSVYKKGIERLKEIKNVLREYGEFSNNETQKAIRAIIKDNCNVDEARKICFEIMIVFMSNKTGIEQLALRLNYSGKLNRFLVAQAKLEFDIAARKRNDTIDLEHFKYLNNDVVYMVSDDRLMSQLDVKKVYSVTELIEFLGPRT